MAWPWARGVAIGRRGGWRRPAAWMAELRAAVAGDFRGGGFWSGAGRVDMVLVAGVLAARRWVRQRGGGGCWSGAGRSGATYRPQQRAAQARCGEGRAGVASFHGGGCWSGVGWPNLTLPSTPWGGRRYVLVQTSRRRVLVRCEAVWGATVGPGSVHAAGRAELGAAGFRGGGCWSGAGCPNLTLPSAPWGGRRYVGVAPVVAFWGGLSSPRPGCSAPFFQILWAYSRYTGGVGEFFRGGEGGLLETVRGRPGGAGASFDLGAAPCRLGR